jgi:transcription elongation factor Elf1
MTHPAMTATPEQEARGEPKLLPCPFCGEERISFNPPDKAHGFKGSINCPACLASVPREVNDDQELIGCWNGRDPADARRRRQPPQPTGDVGEFFHTEEEGEALGNLHWLSDNAQDFGTRNTAKIMAALHDRLVEQVNSLNSRIADADEKAHYANGVADLAMKHRDEAEARAEHAEQSLRVAREALERIGEPMSGRSDDTSTRRYQLARAALAALTGAGEK